MFASPCSFTKNDPLCMAYHPYHFVGEVLLHPVYTHTASFSRPVARLAREVAAGSEYLARAVQALQLEAISTASL